MRLRKINLIGKTVLVNLEQIAFIEKDPDTHNEADPKGLVSFLYRVS